MDRFACAGWACIAAVAGAMTLVLIAPPPAGAATGCAEQVIHDWSEDGRVDGCGVHHDGVGVLRERVADQVERVRRACERSRWVGDEGAASTHLEQRGRHGVIGPCLTDPAPAHCPVDGRSASRAAGSRRGRPAGAVRPAP